jgi:hypothetical protein
MNALVDGESKIARNSPGTIIPERPGSRAISLQITVNSSGKTEAVPVKGGGPCGIVHVDGDLAQAGDSRGRRSSGHGGSISRKHCRV